MPDYRDAITQAMSSNDPVFAQIAQNIARANGWMSGGGSMMRQDEAPPSDPDNPGIALDAIANPTANDIVGSGFQSMNTPAQADLAAMTNSPNVANVTD